MWHICPYFNVITRLVKGNTYNVKSILPNVIGTFSPMGVPRRATLWYSDRKDAKRLSNEQKGIFTNSDSVRENSVTNGAINGRFS